MSISPMALWVPPRFYEAELFLGEHVRISFDSLNIFHLPNSVFISFKELILHFPPSFPFKQMKMEADINWQKSAKNYFCHFFSQIRNKILKKSGIS